MTAQVDDSRHPVVASVVSLRASLSSLAGSPVWGLSTAETEAALLEVTALATQVAQLQLRLLHHAERVDVGAGVGATSAANWVAHATRTTRPAMHRAARLASSLDDGHAVVDAALADAAINVEQADGDRLLRWTTFPTICRPGHRGAGRGVPAPRGRRPRRARPADPGPPAAGGPRPRRRRRRGSPPPRRRRSRRPGRGVVHDVRRRPRQVPRPVHHPLPARLDPPQAPPRPRRTRSSPRPATPDPHQAPARRGVHGVPRDPSRRRPSRTPAAAPPPWSSP